MHAKEVDGVERHPATYPSVMNVEREKKNVAVAKLRNIFGVNRGQTVWPTASAVPPNHDTVSSGLRGLNGRHRAGEVG